MAGFGAMLVLMAVMGADSLRSLRAFEGHNSRIRQDSLYAERTLNRVRTALDTSAAMMNEYFLARPGSDERKTLRGNLQALESQTTARLQSYIQSLPAGRKEAYRRLAKELESYWSTLDAFSLGTGNRRSGSPALRRAVIQRHAIILAITADLSSMNEKDWREADRRIGEISGQFRASLLTMLLIGLGFGLVLAVGTVAYAGQLEKRLEEKYGESLAAQRELRELSKRLVDTEERERRAISRELHDEVGQSLGALLFDVQNLLEIPKAEGALRQGLRKIKASAETCLEEVRDMALLLRPSMLDDLGLVAALEWQAREVSKRTGMAVEMTEENVSDRLPEEHKTCAYRIVQEALNNCARHAHGKNVHVAVRQHQNHLRLSIEDDGRGFDPGRTRGLGLVGMKERVSRLGGSLAVTSRAEGGTRLEVELPLPAPEPPEGIRPDEEAHNPVGR